ncbi:MAG: ABC transporter permease subunit [Acidimicrobiia bacterium]|nr:ABC transporter permease subunit [Acidimicrobiia bacterium]
MTSVSETTERTRPPFWRDLAVLRVAAQVAAVVLAALVLVYLGNNLVTNTRAQGITLGFDFLDQPLGVDIQLSPITASNTILQGLIRGWINTLALVIVGLPLLTVLGVVVGVARLSSNWLVAKLAALYVEIVRNIPPLLIILFVHNVVILGLPPKNEPASPLGWFSISNFVIAGPWFDASDGAGAFWTAVAVAAVAAVFVWRRRTKVNEATGEPHHRVAYSLGLVVLVGVIAFFVLGRPLSWSLPVFKDRLVTGGIQGLGQYFSMLLALVVYTASHVAEIVRGSIQAVAKGQSEAANALALSGFQRLRFVTLPQAARIAVPPIISQYLNYTKNTSLAIGVAYAEVTLIAFQAIGNGQPAPQLILLLMVGYLIFSLTISFVLNIVNRRMQLVSR